MKHRNRHAGGRDRHAFSPEGADASSRPGRHHGHGRGSGGGRRGSHNRLFDYGEIRLLVLSLLADKPTCGYELIRSIEEKFGGNYTPSPGVIYPTLTWLDEARYVRNVEEDGRKNYHLTPEGEAFLAANRDALAGIASRTATTGPGDRKNIPVPVMLAMKNFRTALRLQLSDGGLDTAAEEKVAALLDEAARTIGQA
ncbi:PadR family transcriptional regulator [Acetobacter conturbans]|uniref:PadR family transcriptional regulator n=1 Tax=Acetobacter conturbans TaxID=1737472 RepID=A0ABX0JZU6_9PROT|nr:PadR family transcriptional regulator [Acetobacter conturbans]NHN87955.1 PadR family transcriptional regulator [Acetobacter conturbans]